MFPRQSWLGLIACLAWACTREPGPASTSTPGASASGARPDVLLISIDSLRPDHLGCYGYPKATSPNLDRLAASGVRCATAVSTTSWTLPAHAALFSGLYDSTHGVVDNGLALSSKITTLAEVLRAQGYHTAGFYGGPYLHPVYGLSQGFEHWESCMGASLVTEKGALVKQVLDPAESASIRDVTGPRTLEAVAKHLNSAPAGEPLFVFVHLWDVHYDYRPPEAVWRRFDPDYSGSFDGRDLPHNPAVDARMPTRELAHLVALYDGEIAATDEVLGSLLAAWNAQRDPARSLVIVTGDHGEEFFEHGGKGHQRSVFEELVRIPLIVRWPGHFEGGGVRTQLVRLIDVMPTICAAVGAGALPAMQGRDLGPLLTGGELPPVSALCELLVDGGEVRALRRETSKVIRYKDGRLKLAIDLVRDPGELSPLPDDSRALQLGLSDLEAAVESARSFARKLAAPPRRIVVEDAVQRALKGLGYSGDEPEGEKRR